VQVQSSTCIITDENVSPCIVCTMISRAVPDVQGIFTETAPIADSISSSSSAKRSSSVCTSDASATVALDGTAASTPANTTATANIAATSVVVEQSHTAVVPSTVIHTASAWTETTGYSSSSSSSSSADRSSSSSRADAIDDTSSTAAAKTVAVAVAQPVNSETFKRQQLAIIDACSARKAVKDNLALIYLPNLSSTVMFERVNDSGVSVGQVRLEFDTVQELRCGTTECPLLEQQAKDKYNERHDECRDITIDIRSF
jgi:hypothetical protein